MFQKSQKTQQKIEPRQTEKQPTRRFQIVKLEERIAPACHFNPKGKPVGTCHGG